MQGKILETVCRWQSPRDTLSTTMIGRKITCRLSTMARHFEVNVHAEKEFVDDERFENGNGEVSCLVRNPRKRKLMRMNNRSSL